MRAAALSRGTGGLCFTLLAPLERSDAPLPNEAGAGEEATRDGVLAPAGDGDVANEEAPASAPVKSGAGSGGAEGTAM